MDTTTLPPADFKNDCDTLRTDLKAIAARTIALMKHSTFDNLPAPSNAGEMKANTMLAFRHLEDAAMRVGKAIQAYMGGESPLGGPSTPNGTAPIGDALAAAPVAESEGEKGDEGEEKVEEKTADDSAAKNDDSIEKTGTDEQTS